MTETPPGRGAVQRALEWLLGDTEPVRRAFYPVTVALVALLVGYGWIADERAALWLGVAAAIIGPGATEAARRVAWAPQTVSRYDAVWRGERDDAYDEGFAAGQIHAAEVVDDEPGEHAADRAREPATELLAVSRADRCREVDAGRRCKLKRHDVPPTPGGMPHRFA